MAIMPILASEALFCENKKIQLQNVTPVSIEPLDHPTGTSKDLDICDLSKVSDIDPLSWGSMRKSFFYHLFCVTQESYFSKD